MLFPLQQLVKFNAEYKAALALFRRSNLTQISTLFNNPSRGIHTSSAKYSQPNDDKDQVRCTKITLFLSDNVNIH